MNQRSPVIPFARDSRPGGVARDTSRRDSFGRIGSQPIALAGAALLVMLTGVASIALWRTYTGAAPELDRVVAARALQQARTAQASEQLVEKTKGLEATQQESIDQLQVVQDQLSTVRRLLASQQGETKRLSEQVTTLTEAVEGLRQSFAKAPSSEAASAPVHNRVLRARVHHTARAVSPQKRAKTHG
jgi:chromosome segregation ATPase